MRGDPQVGAPAYRQGVAPKIGFQDTATVFKEGQKSCVPTGCYDDVLVTRETNPAIRSCYVYHIYWLSYICCRPGSGLAPVRADHASSSAKNGFPAVASVTRRSGPRQLEGDPLLQQAVERGQADGPSETRSMRSSGNDRASSTPAVFSAADDDSRANPCARRAGGAVRSPERSPTTDRATAGRPVRRRRSMLGEQVQDISDGQPDRPLIGRLGSRLRHQQRDLERTTARRQQGPRDLLHDALEQVPESGERQRRLALDASVRKNPAETPLRLLDTGLPEDRLADPCLAREHERARAVADARDERAGPHSAPRRAR